jgi:hypothetical protein
MATAMVTFVMQPVLAYAVIGTQAAMHMRSVLPKTRIAVVRSGTAGAETNEAHHRHC